MKRERLRKRASVMLILMASVMLIAACWVFGLIPLQRAHAQEDVLTKVVTVVFPAANHVGLHLELKNDGVVVIDKDYMEQWASGTTVALEVKQRIGARMQADIDAYKALLARYKHADYALAATQVDAGLEL